MAHHRTAPFQEARQKSPRLRLGAVEGDIATANGNGSQVDIAACRLPGSCGREQRCRTVVEPALRRLQAKHRLLTRAADELTLPEAGDRLDQPTLELVALHAPFHPFQTRLEGDGTGRGRQQAEQQDRTQAHGELR